MSGLKCTTVSLGMHAISSAFAVSRCTWARCEEKVWREGRRCEQRVWREGVKREHEESGTCTLAKANELRSLPHVSWKPKPSVTLWSQTRQVLPC